MPGLLATMFVATGAMAADQGALEATTNNAANVNTPGYSRQVPILEETPPVVLGNLTIGTGVSLTRLESIRDPILQLRIQQESGQQGQLNASVGALNQAKTLFTAGASDIGAQISNLFSSIAQLSTDPSSISLRQGVLTAASNLTSTFNNPASNLAAQRSSLDLNVVQSVREVNTLTQQIAGLNGQITTLQRNISKVAQANCNSELSGSHFLPDLQRLAVIAFGLGQIVGPAFAGILSDSLGSFTVPSITAAVALLFAAALTRNTGIEQQFDSAAGKRG